MRLDRIQEWPYPRNLKSTEDVVGHLKKLYMALEEDSVLRIEEIDITVEGEHNTLLGIDAGYSLTTGTYNTLLGRSTGYSITTGNHNIAIGHSALYSTTDGESNVAMGYEALKNNVGGYTNVAVGYQALYTTTGGDSNVAIGKSALYSNTTGDKNVAIGEEVLYYDTTGYQNIGIGRRTLKTCTEGYDNIGLGHQSLHDLTTGDENIAVGATSLANITTANANTALGCSAGFTCITGALNVFLGYNAGYSETGSNKLYIDNSNTTTPLIYGEFDNDLLRVHGELDVVGSLNQSLVNLVKNGSFESWGAGAAAVPDGWTIEGAGSAIAREATIIRYGEYSAKLTRGGTDCSLYRTIIAIDADTNTYYRGKTATFGCWVYATVASRAILRIVDGVDTTDSSYHTGGSNWEFISVTHTLNANATKMEVLLRVVTGNTAAYFDGVMLVEGFAALPFTPNPVDWGDNIPNIISAAPTDVGKVGEVRFYRSGTTRRIYMCDGTDWKYQAIAT